MPENQAIISVEYTINAPYSSSTIKIDRDGGIEYVGQSHEVSDAKKESASGKIPLEKFKELAGLILETGFLSLEERYEIPGLSDASTHTITVSLEGKEKSVTCYGSYPQAFLNVLKKIEELWPKPLLNVGV